MSLGGTSGAERTVPLQPGDALLLYTDGVTEARDGRREFYPLEERVAGLAARSGGSAEDLLDLLRDDLLRHVGAPLDDDAALLLVRVSRRVGRPGRAARPRRRPRSPEPQLRGRSARWPGLTRRWRWPRAAARCW